MFSNNKLFKEETKLYAFYNLPPEVNWYLDYALGDVTPKRVFRQVGKEAPESGKCLRNCGIFYYSGKISSIKNCIRGMADIIVLPLINTKPININLTNKI